MRSLWKILAKSCQSNPPIPRRGQGRLRLEELEVRNLLTVLTPFSLAQQLRSGFSGYTPAQMLAAYGTGSLSISQPGQGETIAIVDAYLSPNIQTDLSTFDAKFNLPAINLTIVNDGATRQDPSGGWQMETALDVEWAHAIAPYANIVLVEAANDHTSSAGAPTALLHAVTVAASQPNVSVVSMSWGVSEFPSETQFDSTFSTPGVTFVAASGDSGTPPIWPAVSPDVVAVGGTTLQSTTTSGVYVESGWGSGLRSARQGGSGGGVSRFETEPSYQLDSGGQYVSSVTSSQNSGDKRQSPDVSYDANPSTGVAVFDASNGGWQVVGGTGAGTPQFAALIALADQLRAAASPAAAPLSSTQTLTALYQEQGDFYDVTSGNNGAAAGTGYDLVTGLGTPQANLLVPALAAMSTASGTTTADSARTTASTGTGSNPGGGGTTTGVDFTLTGTQISITSGQAFTGTVATITGVSSTATQGSFSALILWGDGSITQGTVTADPAGGFDVTGTHTYTIHNTPGWGGGWGGYEFGWGPGGSGQGGSSTENFRITVIVGDSNQEFALTYSTASVSSVAQGSHQSSNQLYLGQLFQDLLGRTADPGALNFWSNVLNGGMARPTVVTQIEGSQEYLGDEVQAVFQKLLQRQADAGGLTAFTSQLQNGETLEQVEETIAGSAEYFQTRGHGQTSGFIDALFADALNRAVDPSGTAALDQALSATGSSRTAAAAMVFGSAEHAQDLVESYFETYLGRQADTGGLDSCTGMLEQGGTDQSVVGAILGSQEYYQKAQSSDRREVSIDPFVVPLADVDGPATQKRNYDIFRDPILPSHQFAW